jgi:hypothetical protein
MKNWPIYGDDGISVNVTAASAATLVATSAARVQAEDVMIDNPGPVDVYVKAGDATATATLTSLRVPAGSLQPFRKGAATHLALRTSSGNQAVVIHVGEGQ